MADTWRDEMYGDESGQDPFWVAVEAADGQERDAVEAAQLVRGFMGPFSEGLTVELVRGRVSDMGGEGFFFEKDEAGPFPFWEVCCS